MTRDEWRVWRNKGIGGSDAPIILGLSPYKTRLELYEEKILSEPPPEQTNFVAERGNRFEPRIRSLVELVTGEEFSVALLESEAFPFIRVSLDGINLNKDIILEIKTVGKDNHNKIPDHYYAQVQHELFVSQAKKCIYASYYDENWDEQNITQSNLILTDIFPDPTFIANMISEEQQFWDSVQRKKPPIPSDKDWKKLKNATRLANAYKVAKLKLDKAGEELEIAKSELIKAAELEKHPRLEVGGIKIQQISREGSINYKSIPELKEIDLEKYRGKGSIYWKIGVT